MSTLLFSFCKNAWWLIHLEKWYRINFYNFRSEMTCKSQIITKKRQVKLNQTWNFELDYKCTLITFKNHFNSVLTSSRHVIKISFLNIHSLSHSMEWVMGPHQSKTQWDPNKPGGTVQDTTRMYVLTHIFFKFLYLHVFSSSSSSPTLINKKWCPDACDAHLILHACP